jgi:hypothetical protein
MEQHVVNVPHELEVVSHFLIHPGNRAIMDITATDITA